MLVTQSILYEVINWLRKEDYLSIDCETTGLRPHHGDELFGISLATKEESFYFNFQTYPDIDPELILPSSAYPALSDALSGVKYFFLMNAKFDLTFLRKKGVELGGLIHDVKVAERCLVNNLMSYSLDHIAKRYGMGKDDEVMAYVKEHGLHTIVDTPGKDRKEKALHFDRVPFSLMSKYAEHDARITFDIGFKQLAEFKRIREGAVRESLKFGGLSQPKKVKGVWVPFKRERELTQVLFNCEQRGILVNTEYCRAAISFEKKRIEEAKSLFCSYAGSDAIGSSSLYKILFKDEAWTFLPKTPTGKINPTFDSEVLAGFKHPAAKVILDYRDAKSRSDYFQGFLHHADKDGVLHPNFDQAGTATGRFSSVAPNCQNLSKEKEYTGDYPVRRALVPRPEHYFLIFDMDQAEYRLLLDHCNAKQLIKKIISGLDVHDATAKLAGISRDQAKAVNFGILYGMGNAALAKSLGVSQGRASEIKRAIFSAAPEMEAWISSITQRAQTRKWVENYLGRRSYFPNPEYAYQAANYIIQGGVADIVKNAMLLFSRNKAKFPCVELVLNVHDELVFECGGEVDVEGLKSLLEGGYLHRFLPLTWGVSHSFKSLYDKTKGSPLFHRYNS
jgi:DNA polymerase-1